MAEKPKNGWEGLPKVTRRPSKRAPGPSPGFTPLTPDSSEEDLERRDRRAADRWMFWAQVLTAISASAAGLGVIMLGMSSPPSHFAFFDHSFGAPSRSGWNEAGVTYAAVAACISFAFAVGALVLRSQRSRRSSDKTPVGMIVLMVSSLIAIALYLFLGG
ncbi:MAG: hypothetical protein GXP55_18835 [Deltaproteobacteria bacterium]|nr:hypothetical protein [Deltaproteobacteria bacterium]